MQVWRRELGEWGLGSGPRDRVQFVGPHPLLRPPSRVRASSAHHSGPSRWRLGPGDKRAGGTPLPALTPRFPLFPARTISTCPSTSRPASCSVGGDASRNGCQWGSPALCLLSPAAGSCDAPRPLTGRSVLCPLRWLRASAGRSRKESCLVCT